MPSEMTRRLSRLLPLLGVVLLLVCSATPAAAAVTTENETVYNGGQADADQAIEVTYTVSPDGGTINNMTVNFDSTARSFIRGDSFSVTVNPGEADIDVQARSGNRFFIREIEPNERVTFVFEVYPTTIKREQIGAVSVRMNYIQNGQELSDSETVTANTSSSPWFQLQASQERVSQLESQLDDVSLAGQFTNAGFLGGILVGLVGLAFGGYTRFVTVGNAKEQAEDRFVDQLRDVKSDLNYAESEKRIQQLIDEYESFDFDDPGDVGSGDDWDDI